MITLEHILFKLYIYICFDVRQLNCSRKLAVTEFSISMMIQIGTVRSAKVALSQHF